MFKTSFTGFGKRLKSASEITSSTASIISQSSPSSLVTIIESSDISEQSASLSACNGPPPKVASAPSCPPKPLYDHPQILQTPTPAPSRLISLVATIFKIVSSGELSVITYK